MINIVANISLVTEYSQDIRGGISSGTVQAVGFGDSVSVSITRPRFYGIWYESSKGVDLSLFYFIPLPIQRGVVPFWILHLLVLISISFIITKTIIFK